MTGLQNALAARRQIEHEDLIARTQFRVGRGAARGQRALEIRGNHLDSFFGRHFAANHDVVRIGIRPQFVEAVQDVA